MVLPVCGPMKTTCSIQECMYRIEGSQKTVVSVIIGFYNCSFLQMLVEEHGNRRKVHDPFLID